MAGPRHKTRPQRRRAAALALLASAACAAWRPAGGCVSFVTAPTRMRDQVARTRHSSDQVQMGASTSRTGSVSLFPEEQMYKISEDGSTLREEYPGGRNWLTGFWGIVQPAVSFGFLVVGLSVYFEDNIVEWTPITAQLFPFLRKTDDMLWIPQGAFMSFYGFFGLFLFGPLQWWIIVSNPGRGVAEFSKKTKRFTKIVDNEVLEDIPFDEIKAVKFEWSDLFLLGKREVTLALKNGDNVQFQDMEAENFNKYVLEKRASVLSEFIDKELEIDDTVEYSAN